MGNVGISPYSSNLDNKWRRRRHIYEVRNNECAMLELYHDYGQGFVP